MRAQKKHLNFIVPIVPSPKAIHLSPKGLIDAYEGRSLEGAYEQIADMNSRFKEAVRNKKRKHASLFVI